MAEPLFRGMKKRTLQIDEDIPFQRTEWRAQRIGIALMFLFVLCALLGLTGSGGLLSRGEAGEPGSPIHVEYDRVVRRDTTSTMTLHLRGGGSSAVRFWIASPYLEHAAVEFVSPEPESVSGDATRHVYTIHASSPDVRVTVAIKHRSTGRLRGEVGLVDGPSARFSQFSFF
jgi:hypothetical protein